MSALAWESDESSRDGDGRVRSGARPRDLRLSFNMAQRVVCKIEQILV